MSGYFANSSEKQGFFELVTQFVRAMSVNGSTEDVNDFLYEIGLNTAKRYPVQTKDTLSRLHLEMNAQMSVLGFGVAEIEDMNTSIKITHRDMPQTDDPKFADQWLRCFSVVLCGIYEGWFRQTGSPSALKCRIEELHAPNEIVFSFKKRTASGK